MRILIASAVYRGLPYVLQNTALALAHRAILTDTAHEFGLWFDFRARAQDTAEDYYHRICAVADRAIDSVKLLEWDYVLWVDADVVEYPGDICSRLLDANPSGITAPLPLIEGSERLYDTFGSVDAEGHRLAHEPPYWPTAPTARFVPMENVGMVLLVPAWIFAKTGVPPTEGRSGWAAACGVARASGLQVGIDRGTRAFHADLPKYGLNWH